MGLQLRNISCAVFQYQLLSEMGWRFSTYTPQNCWVVCVAAYSKNQLLQHPSSCSIKGRAANDAFEPANDVKSKQLIQKVARIYNNFSKSHRYIQNKILLPQKTHTHIVKIIPVIALNQENGTRAEEQYEQREYWNEASDASMQRELLLFTQFNMTCHFPSQFQSINSII